MRHSGRIPNRLRHAMRQVCNIPEHDIFLLPELTIPRIPTSIRPKQPWLIFLIIVHP